MEISSLNNISFGKRKRVYTPHEKDFMMEIKSAAIQNQWQDIYTGKPFSKEINPTIEHVIPYVKRNDDEIKERMSKGFELNGIDNVFPVGGRGNLDRGEKPFAETVVDEPIILKRLLTELDKYKAYKSDMIDGKEWTKRLNNTLCEVLSGICSDIKTRKMFIHKP